MFILNCDLPTPVINILGAVYKAILVFVPLGIILFGVIDFLKASTAAKSDMPSTKTFIKRLVTGVLAFFVFVFVQFVFTKLLPSETGASSAFSCAAEILGK